MTADLNPHQPAMGGAAAAPITVAINAQIDPQRAGGVESALHGLMAYLAEQSTNERYLLLASRLYATELERLAAGRYGVEAWPFSQKGPLPYRRLTARWQRWQRRAGPLGPGVDALHWGWWQARRKLTPPPDPQQADRFLCERGVSAVHFAYAIRFGTSLPFLYEPWDLQHRHYPDFFAPDEWRWRDRLYRAGCEQAALVVAATRWTKRDIVAQYGIPTEKIAVIPRGPWLTPIRPSADDIARARATLKLPERFAFYPAMTFPHKNHLRLFEALAVLRDRHGVILRLVCTGRAYEPHWPQIVAGVARSGLEEQVMLLGSVAPDTLAAIFKAAAFLVFPSLFEGLGLPIIEALEYGLPVVASDATCIPEVGGDAATYFDGTSTESIIEALLLAEREPERLQQTLAAAPAALGRYSWPKAAATFVACYRAVAGAPLTHEQQALYAEAIES
jgi:glycosyltransferase involved in cell wall biosynthesis